MSWHFHVTLTNLTENVFLTTLVRKTRCWAMLLVENNNVLVSEDGMYNCTRFVCLFVG